MQRHRHAALLALLLAAAACAAGGQDLAALDAVCPHFPYAQTFRETAAGPKFPCIKAHYIVSMLVGAAWRVALALHPHTSSLSLLLTRSF